MNEIIRFVAQLYLLCYFILKKWQKKQKLDAK